MDEPMQNEVVAIVVRKKSDGWDWALTGATGSLPIRGHAATQDAAMAEGWRLARETGAARPFPELVIEPAAP
jgi:hypothetical protein